MMRKMWLSVALLWPGMLFAAPATEGLDTSGVWQVDGNVMGQPVKMTCTLTDTKHVLSGDCAGAQDNFAPHRISGKVKGSAIELHFQSAMGGNSLTIIMTGALNADASMVDGELNVEPMDVSGTFVAKRNTSGGAQATAGAAVPEGAATGTATAPSTTASTATAPTDAAPVGAAGATWKIDGDVQGTSVKMTCVLVEATGKLSGTCAGAGGDTTPHKLVGEVKENGYAWRFDSAYEGNPITVGMSGAVSADGTKMNGTMMVDPMGVEGTFVATKQ